MKNFEKYIRVHRSTYSICGKVYNVLVISYSYTKPDRSESPSCWAFCMEKNYRKKVFVMAKQDRNELIIDAVAVLLGDYHINRKYAAILLLKALLPTEIVQNILEDDGIYPFDRNDPRVRKWTKTILSRGKCENCGTTENLEAHHIIKWADYPKGRTDINNGACLCHSCHTEEHKCDASYWMMKAKQI